MLSWSLLHNLDSVKKEATRESDCGKQKQNTFNSNLRTQFPNSRTFASVFIFGLRTKISNILDLSGKFSFRAHYSHPSFHFGNFHATFMFFHCFESQALNSFDFCPPCGSRVNQIPDFWSSLSFNGANK